ncbi:hypothetical protein E2C01_047439 [Portunus trituberculatus]|uniref:Uncharacterized protein n=1 Tax=Portunus trituberculatus TaxID=210409 RepID=A0A5B7GAH6_PORTR|nr:hypothetical protein [Portunus trituberculatus]
MTRVREEGHSLPPHASRRTLSWLMTLVFVFSLYCCGAVLWRRNTRTALLRIGRRSNEALQVSCHRLRTRLAVAASGVVAC